MAGELKELAIGPNLFRFDGRELQIRDAFGQHIVCWLNPEEVQQLTKYLDSVKYSDGNQRRSFRTPVDSGIAIETSLQIGNQWTPVETLNISLTGILVTAPPELAEQCVVDGVLRVRMTFENYQYEGAGLIRRCEADRIGILFPDVIKSDHVDAPQQLSNMVMEVQRRWVQSRSRTS